VFAIPVFVQLPVMEHPHADRLAPREILQMTLAHIRVMLEIEQGKVFM
jgi:hypothetical protein